MYVPVFPPPKPAQSKPKNQSLGLVLNAKVLALTSMQKAVIMSLQAEVKELEKVAIAPPTSIPPSVFEDIIHEIQERNVRKCNLMIFGISEQESAQSKDDRLIAELNDVSKVIKYENPHINTDVIRPLRLGKYDANRTISRPIKVPLENEATVLACIRNSKKLKNNNFKNVFISFDKTPRQIQYYRDLRQELDEKNNNGENNFTIKYFNGHPKIVNLN
ncbi:hypothetical protein JTB14_025645 [Gonioctena quinquepunctata]|nr:hypothetical protein JTB14_025645 [Gonioctena quinquepunctata]